MLPDRVAGYGLLTADAARHPAGKALLLFNSGSNEIFRTVQSLALSEDGRNYRHVSAVDNGDRQALLSPDGSSLLIVERLGETRAFIHLDLKTGKRQEIPLPAPAGVMLLAWSPDGRYVAFAQTPWQGTQMFNAQREIYGKGVLNVLDLTTWKVTELPEMTPAGAASFAPGSEQLAVQRGAEVWVVNVDGSRARQITLPAERLGIMPGVAWSPDGRLLALIAWDANGMDSLLPAVELWSTLPQFGTVSFVDATGAGRSAPEPVKAGHMLGWRTPRSIVALDYQDWTINETSLDDGRSRLLSTFEKAHTCELGMQSCKLNKCSGGYRFAELDDGQTGRAPVARPVAAVAAADRSRSHRRHWTDRLPDRPAGQAPRSRKCLAVNER